MFTESKRFNKEQARDEIFRLIADAEEVFVSILDESVWEYIPSSLEEAIPLLGVKNTVYLYRILQGGS